MNTAPSEKITGEFEDTNEDNDRRMDNHRCHSSKLHQRRDVLWLVLLTLLATAYAIFTTHEVYSTKQELHKINLLLRDVQSQIHHLTYIQSLEVHAEQKTRVATVEKDLVIRKRRSELPVNFLPFYLTPRFINIQTGNDGTDSEVFPNFGLPAPQSRQNPTQDGVLFSSLSNNLASQNPLNGDDIIEQVRRTGKRTGQNNRSQFGGSRLRRQSRNRSAGFGNRNSGSDRGSQAGSTFVRWGRPSCPQNTELVYAGYAAAAYPVAGFGGSTELECLPTAPEFHTNASTPISKTLISAAKFSIGNQRGVFPNAADNSVIACAVCLTTRTPTLMIPGRIRCPTSWLREYYGYLMSTPGISSQFYFSSKNYCVDVNPDFYLGHDDSLGLKLTFLQAGHCFQDKEPCRDYQIGHQMGCTVCSKVAS